MRPLGDRRHVAADDEETRLEIPEGVPLLVALGERFGERTRIGDELLDLGVAEHEEVPQLAKVAGLDVSTGQLAERRTSLLDGADVGGLGPLAERQHVGRHHRALELGGEFGIQLVDLCPHLGGHSFALGRVRRVPLLRRLVVGLHADAVDHRQRQCRLGLSDLG